jgi:2-polyprenyl-3-methyl-5-hydroxy-6-metoxy-1,4-benzoquinol methylase
MPKEIKYTFKYIESCNMCGSAISTHKILGKRLNHSQGKNPQKKIGITTTTLKCNCCGLVYSNPQPIPFDINDHYGVLPENYWKENYFKIDENYFASALIPLKNFLKFDGAKSLDIGAGIGKCMIALEKSGFDSYGFEPSEPFYKMAIEKMKIDPSKLKLGMMEEVDYPENHFDFITFGAVLEHLYDPSTAIIKALKWLKPQGIIHIEVPSSDWLVNKIVNTYYAARGMDYVANISPMHTPYHYYEFTLKSFLEHSKMHNYDIPFHEYYVCYTYLPKAFDFILKPYMKWTNTGMQLCVFLRKKHYTSFIIHS